jgi:UDP-3-O-[3-hydroxymyristoyl] glucosamine N-acyltransferase
MTTLPLSQIVSDLGGEIRGPSADGAPKGVAPPDEAGEDRIALYLDRRLRPALAGARPLVVLTDESRAQDVLEAGLSAWVHPEPEQALAGLVDILHPPLHTSRPPFDPERGVWVDEASIIGRGASLGAGCVIHAHARIGDGTRIGEHAVIAAGAALGEQCDVGAGAWIGPSTSIGDRTIIGPGAVVGSEGFGLRPSEGSWIPVRHVGTVLVGDDVSIGARSVVARGTLGSTRVGSGTRIDAHVQIGHNVRIGERCAIAAQAGIAGSTVVGDGVMIGGQAGLADHVTVGDGARIAAKAGVPSDVPAGATVEGSPAQERWKWLRMIALLKRQAEKE